MTDDLGEWEEAEDIDADAVIVGRRIMLSETRSVFVGTKEGEFDCYIHFFNSENSNPHTTFKLTPGAVAALQALLSGSCEDGRAETIKFIRKQYTVMEFFGEPEPSDVAMAS
jgi:hypothetical protein